MVRRAHSRAIEARESLDRKLKDIESSTARFGSELKGLENSVKGIDSFRRKVAQEASRGKPVEDAIEDTRDLNRYTLCFPSDSYTAGVKASEARLYELGLEPITPGQTFKNTWNDPIYKGINTSWKDSDTGQVLEIQFHTPESFQIKSDNHALYELSRSGSLDAEEKKATDWLQAENYKGIAIPEEHEIIAPPKPPRELPRPDDDALNRVRAMEAALKEEQSKKTTQPSRENLKQSVDPSDSDRDRAPPSEPPIQSPENRAEESTQNDSGMKMGADATESTPTEHSESIFPSSGTGHTPEGSRAQTNEDQERRQEHQRSEDSSDISATHQEAESGHEDNETSGSFQQQATEDTEFSSNNESFQPDDVEDVYSAREAEELNQIADSKSAGDSAYVSDDEYDESFNDNNRERGGMGD